MKVINTYAKPCQEKIKYKRLCRIWHGMLSRCYNEDIPSYKYYGAKGISVCNEWKNDFIKFLNWALNNGYQENLSIDRINVYGNYEPQNCRWTTMTQQARNKRNNVYIDVNGSKTLLREFCQERNIKTNIIRKHMNKEFSEHDFVEYYTKPHSKTPFWVILYNLPEN